MRRHPWGAAWALLPAAILLAPGCRKPEPPEVAEARRMKVVYEQQIAGLEKLVGEAEKGQVYNADQLAVGIEEGVVRELVNATLPQTVKIGDQLTVTIDKAEAYFRFTKAGLLLQSRLVSSRFPDTFVAVELLGSLDEVKFEDGRFSGRVRLVDTQIKAASLGTMAKDVLDTILKDNRAAIEEAIPVFEIPVRLEQAIEVDGLGDGPVAVAPGRLPLAMTVARILPGNKRLWVLLDVKAGPWERRPETGKKTAAGEGR